MQKYKSYSEYRNGIKMFVNVIKTLIFVAL